MDIIQGVHINQLQRISFVQRRDAAALFMEGVKYLLGVIDGEGENEILSVIASVYLTENTVSRIRKYVGYTVFSSIPALYHRRGELSVDFCGGRVEALLML